MATLYPHICTKFGGLILLFNKMALFFSSSYRFYHFRFRVSLSQTAMTSSPMKSVHPTLIHWIIGSRSRPFHAVDRVCSLMIKGWYQRPRSPPEPRRGLRSRKLYNSLN